MNQAFLGTVRMNNGRLASVLNAVYLTILVVAAGFTYILGVALIAGLIGAAWFLAAGFTLRGKVVEILVIVGFVAYLFFRGLLKAKGRTPTGLEVTRETEPHLFAMLDDVARKVRTRQVHRVLVTPGAHIGVVDNAGILGLFVRRRRVLELGYACLHALTSNELRAILAHEYAHFTSRETIFRRFVSKVLTSLQSAIENMKYGKYWNLSPVYHALLSWEYLFRYFASTFCRQREYRADRLASHLFGGNVLASGLMNFASTSLVFEGPASASVFVLMLEGRVVRNVYAAFRAYSTSMGVEELEKVRRELLRQRSGLLDSHPCPTRRIARIRLLNRVPDESERDARLVFKDHRRLEGELSAILTGKVLAGLNVLDALRNTSRESADGAVPGAENQGRDEKKIPDDVMDVK